MTTNLTKAAELIKKEHDKEPNAKKRGKLRAGFGSRNELLPW